MDTAIRIVWAFNAAGLLLAAYIYFGGPLP